MHPRACDGWPQFGGMQGCFSVRARVAAVSREIPVPPGHE